MNLLWMMQQEKPYQSSPCQSEALAQHLSKGHQPAIDEQDQGSGSQDQGSRIGFENQGQRIKDQRSMIDWGDDGL